MKNVIHFQLLITFFLNVLFSQSGVINDARYDAAGNWILLNKYYDFTDNGRGMIIRMVDHQYGADVNSGEFILTLTPLEGSSFNEKIFLNDIKIHLICTAGSIQLLNNPVYEVKETAYSSFETVRQLSESELIFRHWFDPFLNIITGFTPGLSQLLSFSSAVTSTWDWWRAVETDWEKLWRFNFNHDQFILFDPDLSSPDVGLDLLSGGFSYRVTLPYKKLTRIDEMKLSIENMTVLYQSSIGQELGSYHLNQKMIMALLPSSDLPPIDLNPVLITDVYTDEKEFQITDDLSIDIHTRLDKQFGENRIVIEAIPKSNNNKLVQLTNLDILLVSPADEMQILTMPEYYDLDGNWLYFESTRDELGEDALMNWGAFGLGVVGMNVQSQILQYTGYALFAEQTITDLTQAAGEWQPIPFNELITGLWQKELEMNMYQFPEIHNPDISEGRYPQTAGFKIVIPVEFYKDNPEDITVFLHSNRLFNEDPNIPSPYTFSVGFPLIKMFSKNQAPKIEWERTFNGYWLDEANSIIQTTDGGFAKEPINIETLEGRDDAFYTKDTNKPYTGAVFVLYNNGEKLGEGYLKDGEREGKWTNYHENGQIWWERNYKDGKEDGKWTFYYENGQIREEGNYQDGKFDGKWTTYNKDGSIDRVKEYKDGELVE